MLATVAPWIAAGPAGAATYFVAPDGSGDFPTIQAAIDGAQSGDVIQLGGGTFVGAGNRTISFRGKALTVESQSANPAACIVDAEATVAVPRRVFEFAGEGPGSILRGVTITGGYKTSG